MPNEESSSARPLLLDTHCWLWIESGHQENFSEGGLLALEQERRSGGLMISVISIWEVALLDSKGRIRLSLPCEEWVSQARAGYELAPLTPEIAIESNHLPGDFHTDPVDRILAATARRLGVRLLTRDDKLLQYGRQGHAAVVPA